MSKKVPIQTYVMKLIKEATTGDCKVIEENIRLVTAIFENVSFPRKYKKRLACALIYFLEHHHAWDDYDDMMFDCASAIEQLGGKYLVIEWLKRHRDNMDDVIERDILFELAELLDLPIPFDEDYVIQ